MKEVVSEMDIITTLSTQEIISQNKCQMRFLDKLVPKQDLVKKLVMYVVKWIGNLRSANETHLVSDLW